MPRGRRRRAWTRRHVERLLWRAGFGARPKEVDYWARRPRKALVDWLIDGGVGPHGRARMVGPAPRTKEGPLDPRNEWGHDVLWWLDRMVRSQRPVQEKLTLFWHDHFATREQDAPLMLAQNETLRAHALGGFDALLAAMTQDTALAQFLSLTDSDKESPNENYARELLELFTLGVDAGYSQRDVTEAARALTGFHARESAGGLPALLYDLERHDGGLKTVLGHQGALDWRDVLDACVTHPRHAPFLVGKLWDFFVAEPLDARTRAALVTTYTRSGRAIAPLVRAILEHPKLYAHLDEPRMVKWPVVHIAGMLRTIGRPIDTADWSWIAAIMGQQLFSPPSVAGWDSGPDWISTATMNGRFTAATWICADPPVEVVAGSTSPRWDAAEQLERARKATGRPFTSARTDARLRKLADELLTTERDEHGRPPQGMSDLTQAALRHLLLSGPDNQLC